MVESKTKHPGNVFEITKAGSTPARAFVCWGKKEDEQLKSLVIAYRQRCWIKVSSEMERHFPNTGFTAKKCRERWCNSINPALDKASLTDAEELFLAIYHSEYKNVWTLIAKKVPHRSNHLLKNNFSSIIRKICRKVICGAEERAITSLYFLQAIYACKVINEFSVVSQPTEATEQIAPMHLFTFVKDKQVTTDQCTAYLKKVAMTLVAKYSNRLLKKLKEFDKMQMYVKLFEGVASKVKRLLDAPGVSTENFVTRAIEEELGERDLPSPFEKIVPAKANEVGQRTERVVTPEIFSPFQADQASKAITSPSAYNCLYPRPILPIPSYFPHGYPLLMQSVYSQYQVLPLPYGEVSSNRVYPSSLPSAILPPIGPRIIKRELAE